MNNDLDNPLSVTAANRIRKVNKSETDGKVMLFVNMKFPKCYSKARRLRDFAHERWIKSEGLSKDIAQETIIN